MIGFHPPATNDQQAARPMRVLLAFDKFKGSLTAPEACGAAAAGLQAVHPAWEIDACPLADGGDGFAAILTRAAGGRLVTQCVTGPRGEPVEAAFGLVTLGRIPAPARARLALTPGLPPEATIAVVDLASASGLALLAPERRDPWQTSTLGTGELLRAAADAGAAAIVLGAGGSATHDLGLGALAALGWNLRSAAGERVHPPTPARWPEIERITSASPAALPPLRIACDVTNPLLGPRGAVAVYAPQKGLPPGDAMRLEHETARLALLLMARCGRPDTLMDEPGAGAAGGFAFGLMAATGATLVRGLPLVADWLDLGHRLAAADLVLTGEGAFDASSLEGKGPGEVVRRALALGKPVHVFAGRVDLHAAPGAVCHAVTPPGIAEGTALRHGAEFLQLAVREAFSGLDPRGAPSGSTAGAPPAQ
jgi:glycerate kinase